MIQRMPIVSMTRNLLWTRSGVIWAIWRLQGVQTRYEAQKVQAAARSAHHALFQSLTGEALLMGLCAHTDPAVVAERMLAGVDVPSCPEWAEEVLLTMDSLEEMPVGDRVFWLAVPLKAGGPLGHAKAAYRAAESDLRELLAFKRRLPSEAEVEDAVLAARRVEQALPPVFRPTPATAAEVIWMIGHMQHRGLALDATTPLPNTAGVPSEGRDPVMPASAFVEPLLDEGGQSDLGAKIDPRRLNPFSRRYLKVSSPSHEGASYQQLLAMTAGPKGGWQVPGTEFLAIADDFDFSVDWAVRMSISAGQTVRRRNKNAENTLKEQMTQQNVEGETSLLGHAGHLDEVAEALQAYAKSLGTSQKEVEVQATVIYAVGADEPALAKKYGEVLRKTFLASDFVLDPPLGGQTELWWAMLPGTPTGRLTREFAQITTGREFATSMPMGQTVLGDDRGMLVAWNASNGRGAPVLLDLDGAISGNASASFGVAAELGAGKSWLMKLIAGGTIDRGGRVFIIDRTQAREYAAFAKSLVADSTIVCDIANPQWSLDPLRVFGTRTGARHVLSLFATMLGVRPREPLGLELARLLSSENVEKLGITSLGALRSYLRDRDDDCSRQLYMLMTSIADIDLGRVLFDDSLPPIDLDARAIVPLTAGLDLPKQDEIVNEHLFRELTIEKIFGRSIYALLTSMAREVCFRNRDELAGFFVDEAHHASSSLEGQQRLQEFIRDGRKHRAFVGLGSHDPHDFGDEVTRGLIPIRFVLRQRDEELAVRALAWLKKGLEEDQDIVTELREQTSPPDPDLTVPPHRRGEGLMRDVRQHVGRIRVAAPYREGRREALSSTPKEAEQVVGEQL